MNAIRLITEVEGETLTIPNMGQFVGRQVELIIFPLNDDHGDFIAGSLGGLARAFGDDEPEYSASDVREKNPAYGKR